MFTWLPTITAIYSLLNTPDVKCCWAKLPDATYLSWYSELRLRPLTMYKGCSQGGATGSVGEWVCCNCLHQMRVIIYGINFMRWFNLLVAHVSLEGVLKLTSSRDTVVLYCMVRQVRAVVYSTRIPLTVTGELKHKDTSFRWHVTTNWWARSHDIFKIIFHTLISLTTGRRHIIGKSNIWQCNLSIFFWFTSLIDISAWK